MSIQSTVRISLSTSWRTIAEPQPSPTPVFEALIYSPRRGLYATPRLGSGGGGVVLPYSIERIPRRLQRYGNPISILRSVVFFLFDLSQLDLFLSSAGAEEGQGSATIFEAREIRRWKAEEEGDLRRLGLY